MVFLFYFLKRYFIYFFSVTLLLTGLFNVIEFFEKLVRCAQSDLGSIAHFITLNLVPSFFELIPIGAWLATCLLLKEFAQHEQWDTLFLLSIGYKRIAKLFAFAGLVIMFVCIVLYESVVLSISGQAQQFKMKTFKQRSTTIIFKKWYQMDTNSFCYFDMLDCERGEGKSLLLFDLADDFSIKKVVNSSRFVIFPHEQTIKMLQGEVLDRHVRAGKKKIKINSRRIPNFFLQLGLDKQVPRLINFFSRVILSVSLLSFEIGREMVHIIVNRLFFYMQIFFYPLATFLLFAAFSRRRYYKWVFIFLPYVFVIFSSGLINYFFQNGFPVAFMLVPHILFFVFIAVLLAVTKDF